MNLKTVLTPVLLAGAMVVVTACGSDSKKKAEEKPASPATARTELSKTRDFLEQALAAYKSGDKTKADSQISEAYLQHFEQVEGPLEAKSEELTKKLEDGIRLGLRKFVKSSKPAARVEQAFRDVFADMDKAEGLLK